MNKQKATETSAIPWDHKLREAMSKPGAMLEAIKAREAQDNQKPRGYKWPIKDQPPKKP